MLSRTPSVPCYKFHPGDHAGSVGSASSRVPPRASCWAPSSPRPAGSLGFQHQGSNREAVLLVCQQTCPSPDHLILIVQPLPRGAATATGNFCPEADRFSSGLGADSAPLLRPSVSWVQDRFSLPFAERVRVWICPSKDNRTSGTEMFGLLSLRSVVWLPVTLIELEYKSYWM